MPRESVYAAAERLGVSFPCSNADWLRVQEEAGNLIRPEPSTDGPAWSKETTEAEGQLVSLNDRVRELHQKLAEVGRRAASRDQLTFSAGTFGSRRIAGDADAAKEADALRDELIRVEGEHTAVARTISRLRARDTRRHRLKQAGVVGRVKAVLA